MQLLIREIYICLFKIIFEVKVMEKKNKFPSMDAVKNFKDKIDVKQVTEDVAKTAAAVAKNQKYT